MKRTLISLTKNWIEPSLVGVAGAAAALTSVEEATLSALFRLVVCEEELPEEEITAFLGSRIADDGRYAAAYKEAVTLLNAAALELGDNEFAALDPGTRGRALGLLLKGYPHPDREPSWTRRLRLSGFARERVLASAAKKRLRAHLVREFLHHHLAGRRGWELVNYRSFPGSPEAEVNEVSLEQVEQRRYSMALRLSDGSVEEWTPDDFVQFSETGIPGQIFVKSGRQTARVEPGVHEQWIHAASSCAREIAAQVEKAPTEFDCVIVGSGPVGAAAAEVLTRAGMTVAMLESGEPPERNRFDVMQRGLNGGVAWKFPPWEHEMHGDDLNLNTYAVRKVGGSSLAWGAVCPRFLENDFRLQSRHGVGMDWPLDYAQLSPDYLAAEHFMGVSGHDDNPFLPRREAPFPMQGFEMSDSDLLVKGACGRLGIQLHSVPSARNTETYQGRSKCLNYARCGACPVGAKYSADQTIDRLREYDGFHLITNAHVRKVITGAGNRVEAVRYHDKGGREHTLRAGSVILAAQAVENVRILLNSHDDRYPSGVANSSGLLGKFLTDHIVFELMGRAPGKLHPHERGYETAASQQFQEHPRRDRHAGGRIIVRENAGPGPLDIALRSGKWGTALRQEITETFGSFVTLRAMIEQLPDENNRIDLSPSLKNAFGDPAPRLRFTLMRGYEKRGYRKMKGILTGIFKELGAVDVREIMPPSAAGHYMCCHRMGNSVDDSVVDSHCEAHDVQNLYLAGGGSFTTGGVSDPTLTAVALALRAARRISQRANIQASPAADNELTTAAASC